MTLFVISLLPLANLSISVVYHVKVTDLSSLQERMKLSCSIIFVDLPYKVDGRCHLRNDTIDFSNGSLFQFMFYYNLSTWPF
jgi:hypothetical protein